MKKKTTVIVSALIIVFSIVFTLSFLTTTNTAEPVNKEMPNSNPNNHNSSNSSNSGIYKLHDNSFQLELSKKTIKITIPQEFTQETAIIPIDKLLFHIKFYEDENHQIKYTELSLRRNMSSTYEEMGFADHLKKLFLSTQHLLSQRTLLEGFMIIMPRSVIPNALQRVS